MVSKEMYALVICVTAAMRDADGRAPRVFWIVHGDILDTTHPHQRAIWAGLTAEVEE